MKFCAVIFYCYSRCVLYHISLQCFMGQEFLKLAFLEAKRIFLLQKMKNIGHAKTIG